MTPQPGVAIQKKPESKIKLRSILVNAPVTVRDASGKMVHNLEPSEFRLTDNGVEQKITHFDLGGEPISLVVAVETSSRVGAILPELRRTGVILSQAVMGPTGEGAIIGFHDSVDKLQDFTTNPEAIDRTMSRLAEGMSGSRLYDAMAMGVEMLSGRPVASATDLGRRRVLLVIAEAEDKGSEAKLGAVLRQAQLQNITIYSVGISSTRAALQKSPEYKRPPNPAPDGTFGLPAPPGTVQTPSTENQRYEGINIIALAAWAVAHIKEQITENALQIATAGTGGAHMATWKNRSIENAIDEVGGEIHSQYVLTYTPSGAEEDGYHEIKVDVGRKELKVRARPGYYLSTAGS
ncbi:MAG TPA: VWA domain-containing protein [Candidatus Acidoferrum sp.]